MGVDCCGKACRDEQEEQEGFVSLNMCLMPTIGNVHEVLAPDRRSVRCAAA